jgi:hypothetical protein
VQGRVYRLGNPVAPATAGAQVTTWELMPGFDFEPIRVDADGDPTTSTPPNLRDGKEVIVEGRTDLDHVLFFVVGRALNPNDATMTGREGTTQDVSVYTTFVTVK